MNTPTLDSEKFTWALRLCVAWELLKLRALQPGPRHFHKARMAPQWLLDISAPDPTAPFVGSILNLAASLSG